jgi:pimeloyl-ACP methyl ester carboxylesterase/DNA-binding CsgD family transcriptional regulator
VVTLRIRSSITGSPVIVRVGPVEGETAKPLALVMSTELVWPEGFEATVQEAFGLTLAEVEIVRGITLGLPVKDIAEARGRSAETVRTQLRSILAKTEAHSQSELVRVVLGLMDMALMPSEEAPAQARRGNLEPLVYQYVKAPDGRRLEFIEFGNPAGRPVLYMHLDFGFIRWPASAERAARQRNLRVVVPVRAGYGRSDPHPKGVDHLDGVTADYLAILDWLGIRRVAVLALGADLRFALAVAAARPGLVGGILGCAAQLPLQTAAQYDRMDKWQRFILANARYAPKILPFLVQAGFSLARRMGKEKFFAQVNGGSAADMEAFARPEVREALLAGSEVTLSEKILAHHAFARECIGSERDWSALVHAAVVPVVLLQGDQDPQTPAQTIRELMGNYPHLDVRFVPKAGQLLFFAEWPMALDVLERFLPRR